MFDLLVEVQVFEIWIIVVLVVAGELELEVI